jgi:hypothetical protein
MGLVMEGAMQQAPQPGRQARDMGRHHARPGDRRQPRGSPEAAVRGRHLSIKVFQY